MFALTSQGAKCKVKSHSLKRLCMLGHPIRATQKVNPQRGQMHHSSLWDDILPLVLST